MISPVLSLYEQHTYKTVFYLVKYKIKI